MEWGRCVRRSGKGGGGVSSGVQLREGGVRAAFSCASVTATLLQRCCGVRAVCRQREGGIQLA